MYSQTMDEDRANRYSAEEERGRLLLVTTVDLGDGLTDKIELRAGDCPEVWAPPAPLIAPPEFISLLTECTSTHAFMVLKMIFTGFRPAYTFCRRRQQPSVRGIVCRTL